jgi:tRNA A-37 threonylcarbamoyl transferase component Bud32
MDAERWDRVKTIFQDAIEREPAERDAIVRAACAADGDLRAAVERLLAAHANAGGFLDSAHGIPLNDLTAPASVMDEEITPERIGPYRIVRELGRGGMGTVYLAERDDPGLRKMVALKVVHAASSVIVRRFHTETQILAALEHPGIARLYDGGTTDQGLPYFVMEYVDGENLLAYCETRHAAIADRLRLFRRVCEAVQYAHQNFVVHRDLKPSNILIAQDGGPKLLDFGIAKALSPSGEVIEDTAFFARVLTPQYASPEQVRGEVVTTASDVYSLGAILYELLSGRRPYDLTNQSSSAVIERIICEQEPAPPSAQAPEALTKALRDDLDNIVLKALRKDPAGRYATAADLAADVQRHLDGYPVLARPDRPAYRAAKFMRRHRRGVAVAGVAVLSLVVGLAVAVWQARVATIQRERADRRFNDVRQLANALIFTLHDAVAPLPGSTPVRQQIVSEGLKYLERLTPESEGDPALQIELGRAYVQIGSVQGSPNASNLGDPTGAIASFRKAQRLLAPSATRPDASPAVFGSYLDAIRFLSDVLEGDPKLAAARLASEEATRFVARHPNLDEALGFQARAEFQLAAATPPPDSLSHWHKAGAIYDALLAKQPDDPQRQRNAALVEKYVGGYYENGANYASALQHHLRALGLDQQRYSRSPGDRVAKLDVAIDLSNVAYAHWRQNAITEAITMYRQSLAMREELLASDPKDAFARSKVAFVHRQLGELAEVQGSAVEAMDHLRQAVRHYQQGDLRGAEQIDAAETWAVIARLEARGGRSAAACDAFGHAFRLHNVTSDPKMRIVRSKDQKDPLIEIAPRAAACGVAGAAGWLQGQAKGNR